MNEFQILAALAALIFSLHFMLTFVGPTWWGDYYFARKVVPTALALLVAGFFHFVEPGTQAATVTVWFAVGFVTYLVAHILMYAYGLYLGNMGLGQYETWTYWVVPVGVGLATVMNPMVFDALPFSTLMALALAAVVRLRDIHLALRPEWERRLMAAGVKGEKRTPGRVPNQEPDDGLPLTDAFDPIYRHHPNPSFDFRDNNTFKNR